MIISSKYNNIIIFIEYHYTETIYYIVNYH